MSIDEQQSLDQLSFELIPVKDKLTENLNDYFRDVYERDPGKAAELAVLLTKLETVDDLKVNIFMPRVKDAKPYLKVGILDKSGKNEGVIILNSVDQLDYIFRNVTAEEYRYLCEYAALTTIDDYQTKLSTQSDLTQPAQEMSYFTQGEYYRYMMARIKIVLENIYRWEPEEIVQNIFLYCK